MRLFSKLYVMDDELPSQNVFINLFSGALAGALENCLFFPLDTAKTRMQDLSAHNLKVHKGVGLTLYNMMKEEGLLSPYKGFAVTVLGSGPSHGAYFATYEFVKSILLVHSHNSIVYGISGAAATLAHDGIMIPTETIKQRLQMENSPYKSFTDCIIKVYQSEGIRAFYRSYGTQLLMNIPFQSIQFTAYELTSDFINPGRAYNPAVHLLSGAIAGGVAAAVTTPLDVCKTLLNTQKFEKKIIGIKNAILTVYKLAGPLGYFRGVSARVLFVMPSTAICWGVYESAKYVLKKLGE